MNQQWSCAGICVEPQSEQRSLGTNQQATTGTHNNLPETDTTTPAASLLTTTTPTDFPPCSPPSSSSQPDCATTTTTGATTLLNTNSSVFDSRTPVSCPTSSLNKVEESESNSCNYELSSSGPTDDILSSSGAGTLTDVAYPSTSTADNIFDEKAALRDCQLSRIIRRRCKFLLLPSVSRKLLRIVLKQPITLKRLGITSVKVDESDLLPVVVSDAALNLPSLPYSNTITEMNSLAGMPVGAVAADRAHTYDPYQTENSRHELTPSTSTGHTQGKRKAVSFDDDVYQTPAAMHGHMDTTGGPPNPAAAMISGKQQQPQVTANTNSPLLVNLLRSSSPGASAGMLNLQQAHVQRPPATPLMQHMTAPPPQTQGTAGYSSYPYMGQGAVSAPVQPGRMRPQTTPVEASHLSTSALAHPEQQQLAQQQQMRPIPQEVNMERRQQMATPQQQGVPAQQLPQAYYPQHYTQRRPMLPGFAVRGQMSQQQQQQQPGVYAHQQGQVVRPQYIHVQQQPRLPGQPMPVHFHQAVGVEQDVGTAGAAIAAPAPPPPKKRKRPTKKQLKEAEMAQQAAAAAAAQQQQQFMMEQQMNSSRVPSANAHTVDRPAAAAAVMQQVMHGGQPNMGMAYAQHAQGYPPQTLRSPPGVSAQAAPMMQSPSSNPPFYQQQQHIWVPQHQQQMMQQQRPQMMYSGQIPHHWQNSQPHHPRMMYPQADNVSDMSAGSSGSVHTSPMTSRNASVDYSPASQSSSTMSPLYQQQQPNVVYQQPSNQQTPPSGLTYPQPSPSQQQVGIPSRPQQQQTAIQMEMHQQPVSFPAEQQCLDMQPKSCMPVMQGAGDFEMDEELGANIADDCGDYNDLDSIEPMTESGEVGATLMASHQQQMQQQQRQANAQQQQHMQQHQQQQQYFSRMMPPQNRYEMQPQMQQQNVGYMRPMCSEAQMRQCNFPGSLGIPQQQPSQSVPQGYASPQQQPPPPPGTTNLFMSPPQQLNCSPNPYNPQSSPQKDGGNFVTRQQQQQHHQRHIAVAAQQSQPQYTASPVPQQQQSVRTPLSAPPTVLSQLHAPCGGRTDDLRSSRSDGEATPRAPAAESGSATEYDKDPINSTIDAVVMRALSDQDSISSTSSSNYYRASRNRMMTTQPSSAEQLGSSDRKMMINSAITSVKSIGSIKQQGQFYGSQQAQQQFSCTGDGVVDGGGMGPPGSHNGQPAASSSLPPNKMPVPAQQLASGNRGNLHGATYGGGGNEMDAASLPNKLKDQRMNEKSGEQRSNSVIEQHHLTNGHESLNMIKGFAQPCNGMLPVAQANDDDRRLTSGAVTQSEAQHPQRSSPKATGASRRNRRKADLSLEASPRGDEDEITVPFNSSQSPYPASYVRRVSGPGGIVVGCSGTAPSQTSFANISVQSAQNNFSATMARQQQMLKQQPKTS